MKNVLLLALAVFCIFSLASEASAGSQRLRGRRQPQRRAPVVQFNLPQRGYNFDRASFEAGKRAAQRQFRQQQQFGDHCN